MIGKHFKNLRVLAIAPSSRGFGFALFDGHDVLAAFGAREAQGKKNPVLLTRIRKIVSIYKPQMIVLPETADRCRRIQSLSRSVIALAERKQIETKLISTELVKQLFFADGHGTKYDLAKRLAEKFPQELGHRLPPPRKPWQSEDKRMDIFDAVALGLAFQNGYRPKS